RRSARAATAAGGATGAAPARLFGGAGARRNACVEAIQAAASQSYLGRFDLVLEAYRQLIPRAEELGLVGAAVTARALAAEARAWMGDGAEAIRIVEAAFERGQGLGQPRIGGLLRVARALGAALLGDDATAERQLRAAADIGLAAFPLILVAWGQLSLFLADRGRHDEALELAERAVLYSTGERRFLAHSAEIMLAHVLAL